MAPEGPPVGPDMLLLAALKQISSELQTAQVPEYIQTRTTEDTIDA